MKTPTKKKIKHPDEVFEGILEYVASEGYALQVSSKIDISCFDPEFMSKWTIETPLYSYKGRIRHDPDDEQEDNG